MGIKIKHKKKLQMARRMYPKHKVNVFTSLQWEGRKKGIATHARKTKEKTHKRLVERKKKYGIL